ncbi:MAG: hypothetical protein VW397_07675 [Candidatus Margulisiibacteriota bacterium]
MGVHLWLSLNINGKYESNYVLRLLLKSKAIMESLIDHGYYVYDQLIESEMWQRNESEFQYVLKKEYLTEDEWNQYKKSIFINKLLEISQCFKVEFNYNKQLNLSLSPYYLVNYIERLSNDRFKIDILDFSATKSVTYDVFSVEFCRFEHGSYSVIHKPHKSLNKSDYKPEPTPFFDSLRKVKNLLIKSFKGKTSSSL